MSDVSKMAQDEYRAARNAVAKLLHPIVDSGEQERAERLLDAGVIDIAALDAKTANKAGVIFGGRN